MWDKEIGKLIKAERARQKRVINLIASENYVSRDVLAALGSEFTNKYAEGYPGARYYGGNEIIDQVERLCQERALKLFKLSSKTWSVNVQPLSGSPANLAIYLALVPLGGKIMGMELSHGGHLTHGHRVSVTGKLWQPVSYGVDRDSETLDYDVLLKLATKEKPRLIVTGYTAYSRKIDFKEFRRIADSCNAYLMVDMSHIAGLVAAGIHPSPFLYADVVMTTTHKTLRGPRSALIFTKKVPVGELLSFITVSQGNDSRKQLPDLIDKAVFPGLQGGPHINQIAAAAVALAEAARPDFKKYIWQVVKNEKALAAELSRRGWRIVSGGTDTHLMLVDTWLDGRGIPGKMASELLEREGIIVNKNTIPFDTRPPTDPSGIRLGTPAETTRGKKEKDMVMIARRIDTILKRAIHG